MGDIMARIRTVKPELFRHEALYEAEQESGLPLRLAFIGLFTVCDRSGIFRWQPRQLKLDVMPYDPLEFSRVLDALMTRGFIVKYACGTDEYGAIPSFTRHQVINNKEKLSIYPQIDEADHIFDHDINDLTTRERRVSDATISPLEQEQGEGKGREGEGKGEGKELRSVHASQRQRKKPAEKSESQIAAASVWKAYADSYFNRYGAEPVRNAKVNGQIAQVVQRLGAEEAPHVAFYYVTINDAFYIRNMHDVGLLVSKCEAIRTQWATGRQVNGATARQMENTQANMSAAEIAKDMIDKGGVQNAFIV